MYYSRMRIRQATNADADEARRLVFAVLAEYGLAGDPEGIDGAWHGGTGYSPSDPLAPELGTDVRFRRALLLGN